MKIIDTHIHFWDTEKLRYKWLDDLKAINQPHTPGQLPKSGDNWEMEKLVFVQADCLPEQGLEEVRWVTELTGTDSRIAGIVAFAPLSNHNFHAYLQQLRKNPLVKGVRQLIQSEGPGFATQEHFIQALNNLPDSDYSFDICVTHHQLPEIVEMVRECPDVPFVLDHLGKPDIRGGEINRWRDNIRALAAFDNVHCKVSGMVTEADTNNWTQADLQPYVDVVLEAFGVGRLMYGGDYPLMKLAGTDYAGWAATAFALLSGLSEHEQAQVFYDNATAFYRL